MKQSKWDIFFSGLFYGIPFWLILIPIAVDSFKTNNHNMFTLVIALMIAFWCSGMDLTKIQYLEDEVEKLKKKLNDNK